MVVEDRDEAIVVRGFEEVGHLVDDDVLEQVRRFFHKLCVQPDVAAAVVATSPLGLHSL